jgi:hypothetical protein
MSTLDFQEVITCTFESYNVNPVEGVYDIEGFVHAVIEAMPYNFIVNLHEMGLYIVNLFIERFDFEVYYTEIMAIINEIITDNYDKNSPAFNGVSILETNSLDIITELIEPVNSDIETLLSYDKSFPGAYIVKVDIDLSDFYSDDISDV